MNDEHSFNIRQIQRALRILHKNGEDIPLVYEDGIFGPETEKAVIAFQALHGLEPNGIVDYETWVRLMEAANVYLIRNEEPFPIFPYVSNEKSGTMPGKKGKAVGYLQMMLRDIAEIYSGFDNVEITGINDPATQEAIILIHECGADEPCDGRLDRRAWNSVARLFNAVQQKQV